MASQPKRQIVAGIDEAGLGPMLGPLTVGVTAFEVPVLAKEPYRLWPLFGDLVSDNPKERKSRLVVCDSKKLHSSSRGVRDLEECLLPFLNALRIQSGGRGITNLHDFWRGHSLAPLKALETLDWYREAALDLPLAGNRDKIDIRTQKLVDFFAAGDVVLKEAKVLPVIVPEFNRLVDKHRNKSDVNLSAFCGAIEYLWARYPSISLACDRLGGRAYYADALRGMLHADSIDVVSESEELSAYILRRGESELRVSFRVAADVNCFPVALASMIAKYLRELSMEAFNAYFARRQPGLKPTKGYVIDARRWLAETAVMREAVEVEDRDLIRIR